MKHTLKMVFAVCFFLNAIWLVVYAEPIDGVVSPKLVINLPSRTIDLYSENNWVKEYKIAIGKPSTPTPTGIFSVIYKEVNPTWYPVHSGEIIPSGPENPLGYRWMGFYTVYGIHGTNTPWFIGETVSNGCIRMYEADVEELFDIIPTGTPVIATYNRCKIRLDGNGEVSIGIYPDVYDYGGLNLEEVKNKLAEYNMNGWLSDEELLRFIQEVSDNQIVFARMIPIKINSSILPIKAIRYQDVNYIPVKAVAEALGIRINLDETNQVISSFKGTVPGQWKDNSVYILPEDALQLLGVAPVLNEEENCFEVKAPVVLLNDQIIESNIKKVDGIWAVPALSLAKSMKLNTTWDSNKKMLIVKNGSFPMGVIGDQPYIKITQIYNC